MINFRSYFLKVSSALYFFFFYIINQSTYLDSSLKFKKQRRRFCEGAFLFTDPRCTCTSSQALFRPATSASRRPSAQATREEAVLGCNSNLKRVTGLGPLALYFSKKSFQTRPYRTISHQNGHQCL